MDIVNHSIQRINQFFMSCCTYKKNENNIHCILKILIIMLICIETPNHCICGYENCSFHDCVSLFEIYGSWDNWTHKLDPFLCCDSYTIFSVNTNDTTVTYKVKSNRHNKYVILDGLTTIDNNGNSNNQIVTTYDGFWFNGKLKTKIKHNEILMYNDDKLLLRCCMFNDKPYGSCVINDISGNKEYNGRIKNGKKHGKGTQYRDDGSKLYSGKFKDGRYDGLGIMYRNDGNKMYAGSFEDGKYDGDGVLFKNDGSKLYAGEFRHGICYGSGILYRSDGSKLYVGKFKNDEYYSGTLYRSDGSKLYTGEFKNSKYNDSGMLYDINGNKLYAGEFENDKFHGLGVMYKSDGSELHIGEFKDGKFIDDENVDVVVEDDAIVDVVDDDVDVVEDDAIVDMVDDENEYNGTKTLTIH